mmetsp:Transcript_31746/g.66280  ORF Transcript_31746/g.66280 Transcript_31746/m.66280 type:complete len:270 (-) Transcript_31746:605-1414(-)
MTESPLEASAGAPESINPPGWWHKNARVGEDPLAFPERIVFPMAAAMEEVAVATTAIPTDEEAGEGPDDRLRNEISSDACAMSAAAATTVAVEEDTGEMSAETAETETSATDDGTTSTMVLAAEGEEDVVATTGAEEEEADATTAVAAATAAVEATEAASTSTPTKKNAPGSKNAAANAAPANPSSTWSPPPNKPPWTKPARPSRGITSSAPGPSTAESCPVLWPPPPPDLGCSSRSRPATPGVSTWATSPTCPRTKSTTFSAMPFAPP